MNKEIFTRLESVFKEVFDDDKLIIKAEDTPITINSWDSLSQVALIASIEKEFLIKIDFFEMIELDSVSDILTIIKNKIEN